MMQNQRFKELSPQTVLAVAAHPDDLEFCCGGTIAKWVAEGAEVYYLVLTDGAKGTADRQATPKAVMATRRQEQQAAAKLLGVKDVFFGDYEDGNLECNREVKLDVARVIRKVKPEVVMAMDPTMVYVADSGYVNHPDHRAAGQATLDAVFPLARDHLSLPELLEKEHLEPHQTPTVLLVNFEKQNWYEDITETIDKKMAALAAHASQLPELEKVQAMLRAEAQKMGQKHNCNFAEGFIRLDIQ